MLELRVPGSIPRLARHRGASRASEQDGHGGYVGRPAVRPRDHLVGGCPRPRPRARQGAQPRERPPALAGGLGRRDLRRGRPACCRLGRLRVQRAGGGLRQEGPEAARAGVPLPRQRVERRPVDRLRRDRRALHRQGDRSSTSSTPTRKHKQRLQSLGLDLTEHGDANSVEVVLHGAADERKLRDAGFTYGVRIADLEARSKANKAADAKFAASNPKTQLPSGSNSLPPSRRLRPRAEAAGDALPGLVEGADAQPQVARGPRRQRHRDHARTRHARDGKPIFLQHRRPPRARVAVVGARDRVRLRPADATTAPAAVRRTSSTRRARSSCRSSTPTASTSRARRSTPASARPSACSTTR